MGERATSRVELVIQNHLIFNIQLCHQINLINSISSTNQEGRILFTISAIKKQQIRNVREAARVYSVPRTTLQRQLNGYSSRTELRANSHKLTKNEEESLIQWILSLNRCGASPRPVIVAASVRETTVQRTVGGII